MLQRYYISCYNYPALHYDLYLKISRAVIFPLVYGNDYFSLSSETVKTMNMQASRVRFLESKVSLLESLLQSAQSMARECGQKAESLQEKKLEKEEALCAMKIVVHEKENEAKKMERSIIDLDGILSVCKRRITEQNENNASLLTQVSIIIIMHSN